MSTNFGYPVCLSVVGRKCLVVGGGEVAERKTLPLLEAGARIVVVSPQTTPALARLRDEGRLVHLSRAYQQEDLTDAFIVIVATDDRVTNQAVADDARERGILANVADDPTSGSFALPALLRRGDLTVAVSTGGRSPAMARYVRDRLDGLLATEYLTLIEIVAELRAELRGRGRRLAPADWQLALDDDLLELVRQGETDQVRAALTRRLEQREPGPGA